jgi:hypothetical protein
MVKLLNVLMVALQNTDVFGTHTQTQMGVIKATIDMNGLRRWIKNQAKDVIRAVQVCVHVQHGGKSRGQMQWIESAPLYLCCKANVAYENSCTHADIYNRHACANPVCTTEPD